MACISAGLPPLEVKCEDHVDNFLSIFSIMINQMEKDLRLLFRDNLKYIFGHSSFLPPYLLAKSSISYVLTNVICSPVIVKGRTL